MRKIILVFSATLTILLLISCNKMKTIHIYSPDKVKCITIFNYKDVRYIADGKHNDIPDLNFIKLDIQDIPPLGDALHIFWEGKYEWDIVLHKSKIIESKLDTTKFKFNTMLPLNSRGVPTEKKFRKEGGAVFDFYRMKLTPNKGAIVEL